MAPQLVNSLKLAHDTTLPSAHDNDGYMIGHVSKSKIERMTVKYMKHLAPVHNSEVLSIMMRAYTIMVGMPVCNTSMLEIDWATRWLTSLRIPSGTAVAHGSTMAIHCNKGQDDRSTGCELSDIRRHTASINLILRIPVYSDGDPWERSEYSLILESNLLIASTFDDNIASNQTLKMFALQSVHSYPMLKMAMEVTTSEDDGENMIINPRGGWVPRKQEQNL